jgi:hypothetical protein
VQYIAYSWGRGTGADCQRAEETQAVMHGRLSKWGWGLLIAMDIKFVMHIF